MQKRFVVYTICYDVQRSGRKMVVGREPALPCCAVPLCKSKKNQPRRGVSANQSSGSPGKLLGHPSHVSCSDQLAIALTDSRQWSLGDVQ